MIPNLARLTEAERALAEQVRNRACRHDGYVSRTLYSVDAGVVEHLLVTLSRARAVVEAAQKRLMLEGHDMACQFRGCTCGRYDEAKAARQDVQRALAEEMKTEEGL